MIVPIIYKKLVARMLKIHMWPTVMIFGYIVANGTYINIQQPIPIHIYHRNTSFPICLTFYASTSSNILKMKIALVQVKLIAFGIGSKKNIRQSIIIDITNCHPRTIIEIQIIQKAERILVNIWVYKTDTCLMR